MEPLKNLHRKYLEGETSRFEEEQLKSKSVDMPDGDKLWLNYLTDNSKVSPQYLEERVSRSIGHKQSRRNTLRRTIAVAASVLVIISAGLILNPGQKEMTYVDKLVALTEARMLSSEPVPETEEEIIYEDESIIIYFK